MSGMAAGQLVAIIPHHASELYPTLGVDVAITGGPGEDWQPLKWVNLGAFEAYDETSKVDTVRAMKREALRIRDAVTALGLTLTGHSVDQDEYEIHEVELLGDRPDWMPEWVTV